MSSLENSKLIEFQACVLVLQTKLLLSLHVCNVTSSQHSSHFQTISSHTHANIEVPANYCLTYNCNSACSRKAFYFTLPTPTHRTAG